MVETELSSGLQRNTSGRNISLAGKHLASVSRV
jgi:hypothetical protein